MSKVKDRGVDISFWQGKIDFAKVKENEIKFAILREGYRQTMDKRFMEYVFGCKTWGIRIDGVYHFIYLPNDRVTSNSETGILNAQSCLQNVQNAQLGRDEIIIWCDLEYDTLTHAHEKHGITLSNQDIREITVSFCNEIKKAGYRVGLYTNLDYAKNKYGMDFVKKYDIWLADYTGNADIECLYQQYTSEGEVPGISGDVDMNFFFGEKEENNMSKAEKAIQQMEEWARDDSKGYDQIFRWGEKGDYDCSSAVIQAWENAGVPVKSNGATYTGNMLDVFKKCGFTDVTSQINLADGSGLVRADVLLNTAHHTAMYCGNGMEVEASINEKGTVKGGKPGDQTGREFLIRSYRNYPWTNVLRYQNESGSAAPNKTITEVAREVIQGKWGNGQDRINRLRAAGYNPDAIQAEVNRIVDGAGSKKSEDVIAKEVIQGKWGNGQDRIDRLRAAGYNPQSIQDKVNRLAGGGKSVDTVAREVIQGKWGNGQDRINRLRAAGYNPDAVQRRVNQLL